MADTRGGSGSGRNEEAEGRVESRECFVQIPPALGACLLSLISGDRRAVARLSVVVVDVVYSWRSSMRLGIDADIAVVCEASS